MTGRVATALVYLCITAALGGCEIAMTRPDQENFVLDTSRVPIERFLGAVSKGLGGRWTTTDVNLPNQDPHKAYLLKSSDVSVVLSPMPHDRCNPNAPWHTTFDPAYAVDLVYWTSDPAERQAAKQTLFQAASDIGERLTKFEECPPLDD
jgi:hypothetical protein